MRAVALSRFSDRVNHELLGIQVDHQFSATSREPGQRRFPRVAALVRVMIHAKSDDAGFRLRLFGPREERESKRISPQGQDRFHRRVS